MPSSSVDHKSSPTSRKISEIFKSVKPLDRGEKAAALEKASCFTSDHPFFKVVMQPSYVNGLVLVSSLSTDSICQNKFCKLEFEDERIYV